MVRSHYVLAISFALSLLILGYCVFSPGALPKLFRLKHQEAQLQAEIKELTYTITEQSKVISLLSSDTKASRRYLEKVAREDMSLLRQDEKFILFDK